jgi:hypothetical protein
MIVEWKDWSGGNGLTFRGNGYQTFFTAFNWAYSPAKLNRLSEESEMHPPVSLAFDRYKSLMLNSKDRNDPPSGNMGKSILLIQVAQAWFAGIVVVVSLAPLLTGTANYCAACCQRPYKAQQQHQRMHIHRLLVELSGLEVGLMALRWSCQFKRNTHFEDQSGNPRRNRQQTH